MNFAKRIGVLERKIAPKRSPHVAVRFVDGGPGFRSEENGEIDEHDRVVVVRFVKAKDGRPVKSQVADEST